MSSFVFTPLLMGQIKKIGIGSIRPVELPFRVFIPCDLAGAQLLLAIHPLLHVCIQLAVAESNGYAIFHNFRNGSVLNFLQIDAQRSDHRHYNPRDRGEQTSSHPELWQSF